MTSPLVTGVAVVVPVRGADVLLAGCLAALATQTLTPSEVVVVDDSADGGLRAESLPAVGGVPVSVVRSGGVGPYAARNLGWASTAAGVLLFLDARSRPRPGWAAALTATFDDPGVALTGSEVLVLSGASLGAKASAQQQFFRLANYLAAPDFRPYLPTCNLGVRRSDIEAVGGFREVRSGGDADLCWRVLGRPGRRLEPVAELLMDWVPRSSTKDYLEQNYRYGRSSLALREDWAAAGARRWPPLPASVLARRAAMLAVRFAVATARHDERRRVDLTARAGQWSLDLGYHRAHRAAGSTPPSGGGSPSDFDSAGPGADKVLSG